MKKIAYQTPEVKFKALFMESLMAGSGVTGTGAVDLSYGGVDNTEEGMDADAKAFGNRSVWDD